MESPNKEPISKTNLIIKVYACLNAINDLEEQHNQTNETLINLRTQLFTCLNQLQETSDLAALDELQSIVEELIQTTKANCNGSELSFEEYEALVAMRRIYLQLSKILVEEGTTYDKNDCSNHTNPEDKIRNASLRSPRADKAANTIQALEMEFQMLEDGIITPKDLAENFQAAREIYEKKLAYIQ